MPNKTATIETPENIWEATSWEQLQAMTTVEKVTKLFKQEEDQRLYRKTRYLKNQLILQKAKEAGII